MKVFTLALFVIFLSGCAASATPKLVNGKYYMGGDSNCYRYRIVTDNLIMCINRDGRDTGYREAMTEQQLQMYLYERERLDRLLEYKPTHTNCYKTYGGMSCTTY